jgi:hypothetical protein
MEEEEEGGRGGEEGAGWGEEGEEEGDIDISGGAHPLLGGDAERGILGTRRDIHREKSF